MKTIGEYIDATEADQSAALEAADEAVAANLRATETRSRSEATDQQLVKALKKTGPVTTQNPDGSFSTYTVTTGSLGDRLTESVSAGRDTVVEEDEESPADPEAPADPEVPGDTIQISPVE